MAPVSLLGWPVAAGLRRRRPGVVAPSRSSPALLVLLPSASGHSSSWGRHPKGWRPGRGRRTARGCGVGGTKCPQKRRSRSTSSLDARGDSGGDVAAAVKQCGRGCSADVCGVPPRAASLVTDTTQADALWHMDWNWNCRRNAQALHTKHVVVYEERARVAVRQPRQGCSECKADSRNPPFSSCSARCCRLLSRSLAGPCPPDCDFGVLASSLPRR